MVSDAPALPRRRPNSRVFLTFRPKIEAVSIREGLAEGLEKSREEIARNLKVLGVPVEKIVSVTGLSLEKIETL